ncbi:MAG: M48 family metallopeptidase, partial [Acetobacteraceae bacterium]|nr:M48 family metallopeptidase [Acetobacteraceae bacterium]
GGALRLAPDGSDARLLVSDAALDAALEAAQRPRRRAAAKRRLRMAALAAVLVPAGGFALWEGWPPVADALARAVPAEWERSVGTATAAALVGDKRVCDAPAGQAALDALAAKLAAAGGVVPAGGLRVRVLDDPAVNAMAAPGGEVVVFRGLLDKAGSAEELAGVLAHELAHVKHRHGLRGVARVAGLFVLTGAVTGGSEAVAAAAVLVGLSYSRGFEREADADGARMLQATGIGTEGLQAFFARLERDGSGASESFWDYVSTHPADDARIAALRAAERPATLAPAMAPGAWAAVKAICGTAPQGG